MNSPKTSTPREVTAFQSATATVNAVRLHYWVGGNPDGPPVLLWHGFLGTSYSWHKVMSVLAEAGYAVLVPDMRGFGDSDKPAGTEGYDEASASRRVPHLEAADWLRRRPAANSRRHDI